MTDVIVNFLTAKLEELSRYVIKPSAFVVFKPLDGFLDFIYECGWGLHSKVAGHLWPCMQKWFALGVLGGR